MKKMVMLFTYIFFMFSTICSAEWKIHGNKDAFGDETGELTLYKVADNNERCLFMMTALDGRQAVGFSYKDYTGEAVSGVLFKVDNGKIYEEKAVVSDGELKVIFKEDKKFEKLISEMKSGKQLKVKVNGSENEFQDIIYFNLKGFDDMFSNFNQGLFKYLLNFKLK